MFLLRVNVSCVEMTVKKEVRNSVDGGVSRCGVGNGGGMIISLRARLHYFAHLLKMCRCFLKFQRIQSHLSCQTSARKKFQERFTLDPLEDILRNSVMKWLCSIRFTNT